MLSSTFSCISHKKSCFPCPWAISIWKCGCLSLTENTVVRDYTPLQHPTLKRWHFYCGVFFLLKGRIVWVCFITSSVISNNGIWVGWYGRLFYWTALIALLNEAWLKPCVSRYLHVCGTGGSRALGLTCKLLLTGQSCSFNLGNGGRQASRAPDWEKKLILHPRTCFVCFGLFQLLWQHL